MISSYGITIIAILFQLNNPNKYKGLLETRLRQYLPTFFVHNIWLGINVFYGNCLHWITLYGFCKHNYITKKIKKTIPMSYIFSV
jgi:hypothetical protein